MGGLGVTIIYIPVVAFGKSLVLPGLGVNDPSIPAAPEETNKILTMLLFFFVQKILLKIARNV